MGDKQGKLCVGSVSLVTIKSTGAQIWHCQGDCVQGSVNYSRSPPMSAGLVSHAGASNN